MVRLFHLLKKGNHDQSAFWAAQNVRAFHENPNHVLLDFSLTVKAAISIFISGRGSAISSAKEGKSCFDL